MDYKNRSRERRDDDKGFGTERRARITRGPRSPRPARPKRERPPRRQATEAEHAALRAAEQAEIRRAFVADAGVPPKRAPRVVREDREVSQESRRFDKERAAMRVETRGFAPGTRGWTASNVR